MTIETETKAPALQLHHWIGSPPHCLNCGEAPSAAIYCTAPVSNATELAALRSRIEQLEAEKAELAQRLADSEIRLQTRRK